MQFIGSMRWKMNEYLLILNENLHFAWPRLISLFWIVCVLMVHLSFTFERERSKNEEMFEREKLHIERSITFSNTVAHTHTHAVENIPNHPARETIGTFYFAFTV